MSFTNLSYDKGAYTSDLNQSVGPGVYRLGEPSISCEGQCYPYPPTVRLQRQGDSISKNNLLVDVDSELLGITRKLSEDPTKQYQPNCVDTVCSSGEACGQGVVGQCSGMKPGQRAGDQNLHHWQDFAFLLKTQDYQILLAISEVLDGIDLNGSAYDPQDRVEIPFDWNISDRIVVKDKKIRSCIEIDPVR